MTWKDTETIERPSPSGRRHARLGPLDTVTWGPVRAEWTFTFYRLVLDERPIEGVFTGDLVWDQDEDRLAAVLCANPVAGDGGWNYAPEDWRPRQELVVIEPDRARMGRAAFQPDFAYKPKAFEPGAIVYDKGPPGGVGTVWEMEVEIAAIVDWRPLSEPHADGVA